MKALCIIRYTVHLIVLLFGSFEVLRCTSLNVLYILLPPIFMNEKS